MAERIGERMAHRTPPEDEDLQTQTSTSTDTYISSLHPPLTRGPSSVEDDENDDGMEAIADLLAHRGQR